MVLFKYVTNILIFVCIHGYLLTGICMCIRIRRSSCIGIRIRIGIHGYANFDIRSISSTEHWSHTTPDGELVSVVQEDKCHAM